ncbi:hypothetical protein DLAC_07456 [Tieghemostelium lacteum]|uniref:Vitamin K epoxide reductase domain-containing protein n=1 Tax=Tieghemostelium lacteum TaxID=361077 RepID=A0A151ZCL6_TIELA|nr:hypothetical protein DLAC_07456 [Tieghemostelium lacteum]|eukprot:KYQ91679.1 hypothetical protein DLAC_07456 [Tieghemostelium lacteum]
MNRNGDLSVAYNELRQEGDTSSYTHTSLKSLMSHQDFSIMFFLSVISFTVSTYLAFGNTEDGTCDFSAKVSCSSVLSSSYGKILDVPVAMYGMTWNIVYLYLLYKLKQHYKTHQMVTLFYIWNSIAIGFVLYFVIAEYLVGSICPFCTIVHVINVVLMVYAFRMYNALINPPPIQNVLSQLKEMIGMIIILHLVAIILFRSSPTLNPASEPNEEFSKCLRDMNMVFYGSYQCHVCVRQKKLFQIEGVPDEQTPWNYINFVECTETDECSKREILRYPTWIRYTSPSHEEILSKHEGIMTKLELSRMSSCPYEPEPPVTPSAEPLSKKIDNLKIKSNKEM